MQQKVLILTQNSLYWNFQIKCKLSSVQPSSSKFYHERGLEVSNYISQLINKNNQLQNFKAVDISHKTRGMVLLVTQVSVKAQLTPPIIYASLTMFQSISLVLKQISWKQ